MRTHSVRTQKPRDPLALEYHNPQNRKYEQRDQIEQAELEKKHQPPLALRAVATEAPWRPSSSNHTFGSS
jgi:hypothetical protein